MSVFEAIKNRRSVREYLDKPVEKEKIAQISEAARLSPSANNNQPWSFIVITEQEVKEKLLPAYYHRWFIKAPVVIVACASPKEAWTRQDGEEIWKIDVALAVQSIVLTAYELGLGTCILAAFDEQKLKETLNIPRDVRAIIMVTLGYAAEEKDSVTKRKQLAEIIHNQQW